MAEVSYGRVLRAGVKNWLRSYKTHKVWSVPSHIGGFVGGAFIHWAVSGKAAMAEEWLIWACYMVGGAAVVAMGSLVWHVYIAPVSALRNAMTIMDGLDQERAEEVGRLESEIESLREQVKSEARERTIRRVLVESIPALEQLNFHGGKIHQDDANLNDYRARVRNCFETISKHLVGTRFHEELGYPSDEWTGVCPPGSMLLSLTGAMLWGADKPKAVVVDEPVADPTIRGKFVAVQRDILKFKKRLEAIVASIE